MNTTHTYDTKGPRVHDLAAWQQIPAHALQVGLGA